MIARRKKKLILVVCRKITPSHTVDRTLIDPGQRSLFLNTVRFHPHIRDRIQIFFIVRDCHIGRIGDLHLVFRRKTSVFQIHIIDFDTITLFIVRQSAHGIG